MTDSDIRLLGDLMSSLAMGGVLLALAAVVFLFYVIRFRELPMIRPNTEAAPSAVALRAGLPPLPERMRGLSIDHRGFPVPWFVAWVDGKPDHRVMDASKVPRALGLGLCWQCGQPLGKYKSFCIGPMCSITRTISEPPSHRDCLRFAVTACPFLSRPHAHRREAGMPEEARPAPGTGLKRNPGAICIWTTLSFRPFRAYSGNAGLLFQLGDPVSTEWYCEGRQATRAEVEHSIDTGLPLLLEQAHAEDAERGTKAASAELERRLARERAWLDAQAWEAA